MTVIDLTTRRLERLEEAHREMTARLAGMDDSLGRIVTILEMHSTHFERLEDALFGIADRVDRLATAIARGRTKDLERLARIERRLSAVERRRPRRGRAKR
jgi:hypothetical protein